MSKASEAAREYLSELYGYDLEPVELESVNRYSDEADLFLAGARWLLEQAKAKSFTITEPIEGGTGHYWVTHLADLEALFEEKSK